MRFSGIVGFESASVEGVPGVFTANIVERSYFGDVIRNARRLDPPQANPPGLNSDLTLENSFSIVADENAYENYTKIRYVIWNEDYWRVTTVEVKRPRLILNIGGVWNGAKA